MKNRLLLCAAHTCFFAFAVCAASDSQAETLVLQQGLNGYTGTTDTSIFEDYPANSAGGFPWLYAGDTQFNSHRRSLIRFNFIGQIPAGATITSASLVLYCDQARPGNYSAALHLLTRSWNEGSNQLPIGSPGGSGVLAQPGDTTWSHVSYSTVAWAPAGGEFVADASATGTAGEAGTYLTLTGLGLAQNIQNFIIDPSINHGWIIRIGEDATWNAKRLFSSEANDPRKPSLTIEFLPPSSIAAWHLY